MGLMRASLLLRTVAMGCMILVGNGYAAADDARPPASSSLAWLSLGMGPVGRAGLAGFGGRAALSYSRGGRLVSLRALSAGGETTAFRVEAFGSSASSRSLKRVTDVSCLYGVIGGNRWGFASLSAGIGVVWGTWGRQFRESWGIVPAHDFTTVGMPIEAQLVLTPAPGLGLGTTWFMNLNPESSYVGFLVSFQLLMSGTPEGAIARDTPE